MNILMGIAVAIGVVMLFRSLFTGCGSSSCDGSKRLRETRKSRRNGVHKERLDVCAECGYGRIEMLDSKGEVLWIAHETIHVERRR